MNNVLNRVLWTMFYPQYEIYLQAIKNTGMVGDAKEGFEKVLADKEGTFAFIHDASQVNQQHMLSVYSQLNLLY